MFDAVNVIELPFCICVLPSHDKYLLSGTFAFLNVYRLQLPVISPSLPISPCGPCGPCVPCGPCGPSGPTIVLGSPLGPVAPISPTLAKLITSFSSASKKDMFCVLSINLTLYLI